MTAPQEAQSPLAGGLSADNQTDTPIVADDESVDKIKWTLVAKFALVGFAVHELAEGGFLVCKWNLSRHCPDLPALMAFARQVGAQR